MKRVFAVLTVAILGTMGAFAAAPTTTAPFNECPAIGSDTSCGILIIINTGGSLSVLVDSSQVPYDTILGSPPPDDTLVGVLNNSGVPQASITLSGVGTHGIPIFNFDGERASKLGDCLVNNFCCTSTT